MYYYLFFLWLMGSNAIKIVPKQKEKQGEVYVGYIFYEQ